MNLERPYLDLLNDILSNGEERVDRTGTGTISVFGRQLRFDISDRVPAITTKSLAWKTCIKELLWFMQGSTDAKALASQGVHIWDGNSSRSALDARGLHDYNVGDIGPGYGFQWRHFGAEYHGCDVVHKGGIDQLAQILDQLKNDPYSRRIIMSAWNASSLSKMALPPCHVMCQFYVNSQNELSCHMYQRSADCFLGLPFNIFSYTALTHVLARMANLKPKDLVISIGDAHIYMDHVEQVREQLTRCPYDSPRLVIDASVKDKTFEDITLADFSLENYQAHPAIRAKMSI